MSGPHDDPAEVAPPAPLPDKAPMPPDMAAGWFRRLVTTNGLRLAFTLHARRRLAERGITSDGLRHLLATGRVPRRPSRVDGLGRSKYTIEGTPGPEDLRPLRIVVVAAPRSPDVRVVTVMWVDEPPA